eukprot:scaffold25444_cov15-Prasinocladus_malaysianus.AAC.1
MSNCDSGVQSNALQDKANACPMLAGRQACVPLFLLSTKKVKQVGNEMNKTESIPKKDVDNVMSSDVGLCHFVARTECCPLRFGNVSCCFVTLLPLTPLHAPTFKGANEWMDVWTDGRIN